LATTEEAGARRIIGQNTPARLAAAGIAVPSLLTIVAVLIHGFHPYAEDAGVYLPAVLKILHPELYPAWAGFVTAPERFSFFAVTMAGLVRLTGASLTACIFAVYLASTWITLYAAWRILRRCRRKIEACIGGVSILALCLSMPIAGTSLMLFDPYVTARSISTPCSLLAIASALDLIFDFRQHGRVTWMSAALCVLSLVVAALMHPLMAAYAAGCVVLLACSSIRGLKVRIAALGSVALVAVVVAALLNRLAPERPAGYALVARTRYYWFPENWHWYEILGLIAPLLLIGWMRYRVRLSHPAQCLARMAIAAGLIGMVVWLFFAREASKNYAVAMLQPLRIFLMVYIVLILLAGAELGDRILKGRAWRWSALFVALGGLMLFVQLESYPRSAHLELQWSRPSNDWEKGFLWVKGNTPRDAIFALDAHYITIPGEDAQNFPAIAERSALPDYMKEGGVAAIQPDLTADWLYGERVQEELDQEDDVQRRAKLAGAHIDWVVLTSDAATNLPCPYRNDTMKVCRVGDWPSHAISEQPRK
jgi:hypothetical protein